MKMLPGSPAFLPRRHFLTVLAGAAASLLPPSRLFATGPVPPRILRLAASIDTLAGANLNDAQAACKIWTPEIVRTLRMQQTEVVPEIFLPSHRIAYMIREGTLDAAALTSLEYAKLDGLLDPNIMLVDRNTPRGVEYLLLVRKDSGMRKIADLRGKRINLHHNQCCLLLYQWLSLLLAEAGLRPPNRFFDGVESSNRLHQVLLPVFFGRAQAAVIDRPSFDAAVALNPQLARELQVIATSPKVLSVFVGFRRGCNNEDIHRLCQGLRNLAPLASGQWIFHLYGFNGYAEGNAECMGSTLDMIRRYERIKARQG